MSILFSIYAQHSSQPNIVLIFVDDMGYGDLECYGNPVIRTPHLNKLAKEGIRFTSFYAPAAVCTPSRAGLLTGKYPIRNAPNNFGPETEKGLPLTETTIADVLSAAGYRTAAIGKWHLGHNQEYLPTARGFDSFYGLPYSNDMILPWCPWLTEEDRLFLYKDAEPIKEIGKKQSELIIDYTKEALKVIHAHDEKPFFLYLAHSMPHLPVSAPERFQGRSMGGVYGDVIESIDWSVGEIITSLKQNNIDKETLVIFTSDNGPWHNLPERMLADGVKDWHTGSNGPLSGAKATTYEGGYRVPAIFHWPGIIPEGQVNRDVASAIDIFPTLVQVSGKPDFEVGAIDGMNLMETLKGNLASPRSTFYYGNGNFIEAIREDEWKLRITEADGVQLFNLNLDPAEMYNRALENPEVVSDLKVKLNDFIEETGAKVHVVVD